MGAIVATWALPRAAIPAKAGINPASHWKCAANGLDSRFRGIGQRFEGDTIPNDTASSPPSGRWHEEILISYPLNIQWLDQGILQKRYQGYLTFRTC